MLVASEERIVSMLEASGPPIGVVPGISWQDVTGTIKPGETLMFYTDGIV